MVKFYSNGGSDAVVYAIRLLHDAGVEFLPCPDDSVTHLLLPVPTFDSTGQLIGGGKIHKLLEQLPSDVCVIGGHLDRPELQAHRTIDLLQYPYYVSKNAAITAHCAIRLAVGLLPRTLADCAVLVIGWGRIGKCLARLLRLLGADVTVAARNPADRAMLRALGYRAIDIPQLNPGAYQVIFNTAPTMLLPDCPGNALKIDLASRPGIGGNNVIQARGLPGKYVPESSGTLIADAVLQIISEGGHL